MPYRLLCTASSPRRIRRGPIEGSSGLRVAGCAFAVLHGEFAVAPLKVVNSDFETYTTANVLHGEFAVAPLKDAVGQTDGAAAPDVLHGEFAVAPLKGHGRHGDPHAPPCSPRR